MPDTKFSPELPPVSTYSINDIVAYVMHTPENVNPSILLEMLNNMDEGGLNK